MAKTKKPNSIPKHLIVIGSALIIIAIVFVILIINNPSRNEVIINNNQEQGSDFDITDRDDSNTDKDLDPNVEVVDNLGSAIATTVGASLITSDGKVINDKGQVVQNNATPMTDLAPRLSDPTSPDELIPGTIKIVADENGFTPNTFRVKAGEPVTFALTASGVSARLVFKSPALSALELPVKEGYTLAKTFNAPAPGEYTFFQDMPGKYEQTGTMIVE